MSMKTIMASRSSRICWLRKGWLCGTPPSIQENSTTRKDEDYIKTQILAPAIKWAGVFICYVSPQTKSSDWVNWEKQGKRIVGVWAHGEKECDLPDALKEYADAVVGWNGNSIIDAINGKDSWEKPDGGACDPVPIKRHPC